MAVKYPKLTLLACIILASYIIFTNPAIYGYFATLGTYTYLGAFIAGILFAFGFSAPIAIAIFLVINPTNIYLATALGGFGSVLGDLFIINIIPKGYGDEFDKIKRIRSVQRIMHIPLRISTMWLKNLVIYVIAACILITPIPDEIGIGALAGFVKLNQKIFSLMSFLMHSIGIYFLLWI